MRGYRRGPRKSGVFLSAAVLCGLLLMGVAGAAFGMYKYMEKDHHLEALRHKRVLMQTQLEEREMRVAQQRERIQEMETRIADLERRMVIQSVLEEYSVGMVDDLLGDEPPSDRVAGSLSAPGDGS